MGTVAQITIKVHGVAIPEEADRDVSHPFWDKLHDAIDEATDGFLNALCVRFPGAEITYEDAEF